MTTTPWHNPDGSCHDELFALGGRGLGIFTADGTGVCNSGADFLRTVAQFPEPAADIDVRSDDKGTESESVTPGEINGRTHAFIGLERTGVITAYDITDPPIHRIRHLREIQGPRPARRQPGRGDIGPAELTFIPAAESSNGRNLSAAANEVSGTTTILESTTASAGEDGRDNGNDGDDNGEQLPRTRRVPPRSTRRRDHRRDSRGPRPVVRDCPGSGR